MPAQSAKTEMMHTRIDPRLKRSAEQVFSGLGLSTAEAIRLFLKQVELQKGLPFPVAMPNAETVKAMEEANNPVALRRYKSFRELRKRV
jgi:DNA-damage-inducible protein J